MLVTAIAIIELVIIILLVFVIREYGKERSKLKKEISVLHQDIGYRMSAHIDIMFKHANAIRHILPKELYIKSPKKNNIVKETCNLFYEKLINKLK